MNCPAGLPELFDHVGRFDRIIVRHPALDRIGVSLESLNFQAVGQKRLYEYAGAVWIRGRCRQAIADFESAFAAK